MKYTHIDAQMRPAQTGRPQFQHLPRFAKCAIERLDRDESLRTNIMLDELLDGYAKSMGQECDSITRDCAHNICMSRYYGAFSILG